MYIYIFFNIICHLSVVTLKPFLTKWFLGNLLKTEMCLICLNSLHCKRSLSSIVACQRENWIDLVAFLYFRSYYILV